MALSEYPIPAQPWQTELEIKRSRFLTFAGPAANKDQAEAFIRALREQHPQASHVCWAYIAGAPNTTVRSMSDDGEPSGTAGMPMLKVLQHSGLGDIVVAVVRYFGGTKLGTGGLQRAYSEAVAQVLADLPTQQKVSRTVLQLTFDYAFEGAITRLMQRLDVAEIIPEYGAQVVICCAVSESDIAQFKAELVNLTAGNINIQPSS